MTLSNVRSVSWKKSSLKLSLVNPFPTNSPSGHRSSSGTLPTNATMADVVALAGPPHTDLASGIYHWVYRLKDDARADISSGNGTTIGWLRVVTACGEVVMVIAPKKK